MDTMALFRQRFLQATLAAAALGAPARTRRRRSAFRRPPRHVDDLDHAERHADPRRLGEYGSRLPARLRPRRPRHGRHLEPPHHHRGVRRRGRRRGGTSDTNFPAIPAAASRRPALQQPRLQRRLLQPRHLVSAGRKRRRHRHDQHDRGQHHELDQGADRRVPQLRHHQPRDRLPRPGVVHATDRRQHERQLPAEHRLPVSQFRLKYGTTTGGAVKTVTVRPTITGCRRPSSARRRR